MTKYKRAARKKELLVYVLHFDKFVDGRQHYVGLTTCDGLIDRIRRHVNGRGSSFTRKAYREGAVVLGVGHHFALSPADERAMMAEASARELCPTCSPHPGDVTLLLNLVTTDNGDVASLVSTMDNQATLAAIRKPLRGLLK